MWKCNDGCISVESACGKQCPTGMQNYLLLDQGWGTIFLTAVNIKPLFEPQGHNLNNTVKPLLTATSE